MYLGSCGSRLGMPLCTACMLVMRSYLALGYVYLAVSTEQAILQHTELAHDSDVVADLSCIFLGAGVWEIFDGSGASGIEKWTPEPNAWDNVRRRGREADTVSLHRRACFFLLPHRRALMGAKDNPTAERSAFVPRCGVDEAQARRRQMQRTTESRKGRREEGQVKDDMSEDTRVA